MKYIVSIISMFISFSISAQTIQECNKNLKAAYEKIQYWSGYNHDREDPENVFSYDSLEKYQSKLEGLLLKYTSNVPATLKFDFKELKDLGMNVITSEDGLFRIYCWDREEGGSMHNFYNVFQFQGNNKVLSKKLESEECLYKKINEVVSDNKKFYLTQNVAIGSSAVLYHEVKVFSIDDSQLNDKALLIKTKTGIRNELGYEVDLSASSNRDRGKLPDYEIQFDKQNKIISIPLIQADGKVTDKRIKYQFKGKYFEKVQ